MDVRLVSLLFTAVVFLAGCSKGVSTGSGPAATTLQDLPGFGSHVKSVHKETAPGPAQSPSPKTVEMYSLDLTFDDAKKAIEPVLLNAGWQKIDVPPEKEVKEVTYLNLSKGTYQIVAPKSGLPDNATLVYMPFQPGDIKVGGAP